VRYILSWKKDRPLRFTSEQGVLCETHPGNGTFLRWSSYIAPQNKPLENPASNHDNGLLIVHRINGQVEISSDHFGTIPVFYGQARDGTVYCSNEYDAVASRLAPCTVDHVGFWEMALFETPFCGRTALEGISILDPATTLVLRPDGNIERRPYWHFTFEPVLVPDERSLAHESLELLQQAFAPVREHPLVFPIGGGVDCRLSAAALSEVISADQVHGITYGYSPLIFEYRYAKQVFTLLGLPAPAFHRLTEHSYLKYADYLTRRNGALVSLGNAHLLDYLTSRANSVLQGRILISNMYSDAICGWAAKDISPSNDRLEDLEHIHVLNRFVARYGLPHGIYDGICADLLTLRRAWKETSFTSLEEYIYVHERNAKFHLVMSDMWRPYLPVHLPFAQWDVATHFFGIPNRYRQDKRITYLALDTCFPALARIKNVSSAFRIHGLKSPWRVAEYRGISSLNGLLRRGLGLPIYIVNRYETENRNFYLRWHWQTQLQSTIVRLHEFGLIDDSQRTALWADRKHFPEPVACQLMNNLTTLERYMHPDQLT
jgi:hypothetical protein